MLETRILDSTVKHIWDNFVDHNEHGTLFHKNAWLELCESTQKAKLVKLGFFKNGDLIGIFPIFIKWFFVLKVGASPIVVEDTPYMGPLCIDEKLLPEVLQAIETFLKKHRINFIRIIFQRKQDEDLFRKFKYAHVRKTTHVLELARDKEVIWKNMEGRARTAVRKAEKSGVSASFVNGIEYLDKYYELLEAFFAFQKNKVPPNSKVFYRSIFEGDDRNYVKMVIGKLGEVVIGGAIFLHHRDTIYYLDAVNDKTYTNYNGSSLIQWFIICWGVEQGFRHYDFVGSDFASIGKFKASFGGNLLEYSLFEKGMPEWVDRIKKVYGYQLKPAMQRIKSWKYRLN